MTETLGIEKVWKGGILAVLLTFLFYGEGSHRHKPQTLF